MKQVTIKVEPELFASARQSYILDRKGVVEYNWENTDGMLVENLRVNQSSYDTYNYFKYRRDLESESAVDLVDVSDGVVEIRYDCDLLIFADQCVQCGTIDNLQAGSSDNFSSDSVYDASTGCWVCASLM